MRATTKEQGFYSQIFKLVLPIVIQAKEWGFIRCVVPK